MDLKPNFIVSHDLCTHEDTFPARDKCRRRQKNKHRLKTDPAYLRKKIERNNRRRSENREVEREKQRLRKIARRERRLREREAREKWEAEMRILQQLDPMTYWRKRRERDARTRGGPEAAGPSQQDTGEQS